MSLVKNYGKNKSLTPIKNQAHLFLNYFFNL